MSSPRLLVVDGNPAATRQQHVAAGGSSPGEAYADLLREFLPASVVDICFPADAAVNLPIALAGYDGAAVTGSPLHIYDGGPGVTRQVELVRAALGTGVPVFGSCWGLQVITAAAGGSVRRNPKGREIIYGRDIRLNTAGQSHPMYADKAPVFDAVTFHLDEVEALAPGTTVLASNAMSDIQAVEIDCGSAIAWGVQYHPEFTLREVAAIMRRSPAVLIGEGFFANAAGLNSYVEELDALDRNPSDAGLAKRHKVDGAVLDRTIRIREIANWIAHQVTPQRGRRGRG